MAIVINGRFIKPIKVEKVDSDTYEVTLYEHYGGEDVTVKRIMYGNVQCEICRLPFQAAPGECLKCNDCLHALGRFEQGRLHDPAWIRAILDYLRDRRARARR